MKNIGSIVELDDFIVSPGVYKIKFKDFFKVIRIKSLINFKKIEEEFYETKIQDITKVNYLTNDLTS